MQREFTIHGDTTTVGLVLLPLDDNMLISQVGQFLEKFNLELHEDTQGISWELANPECRIGTIYIVGCSWLECVCVSTIKNRRHIWMWISHSAH